MTQLPHTISVIIRFHDESKLSLLEQALFSLSVQSYADIQPVVMLQNGSPALVARLEEIFSKLPFITPNHRIIPVPVAEGQDGRSILLNHGLQAAQGRYLAFLDYDDVMYQHAYTLMMEQLKTSGATVIVAGCRKAHQQSLVNGYHITKKEAYLDKPRTKFDLFAENFIPFHSFVIDRKEVKKNHLSFDETLSCYEDYLFLLTLAAHYPFDFALLGNPVAEYRIRTDGSNSIPAYSDCSSKQQAWDNAKAVVDNVKQELVTNVTIAEIAALVAERNHYQQQVGTAYSDALPHIIHRLRQMIRRYPRIKAILLKGFFMTWRIKKRLLG